MHVSVVIPTYKRPESLSRCLDALACQDTQAAEILVVIRRDDEATQRVVDQYASDRIRHLHVRIPAGRPGLVAALNAGTEASSGQIVCLTDDDAVPRPDWITRIVAAFAQDSLIGAVGGRDWVYYDGKLIAGDESIVGTVNWYGRCVGNHHLGVGPSRDVATLKGVNLSVRGELLRQLGFDTRLRGSPTEHHSELGLCLRLLRLGYRVVYDPAIAVEHYLEPRADGARIFAPHQVGDAAHNETLALLEHLKPTGRVAHLLVATAVGTADTPGLAQALRSLVSSGTPRLRYVAANLGGRSSAAVAYRRTRREHAEGTTDTVSRLGDRHEVT
jgi:GT2 family glycosyltransferase